MKWKRYLLAAVLMLIPGILEILQAFRGYEGQFFELPSYGNFLVKWLQGMPLVTGSNERQLKIPIEWFVLHGGYLMTIVGYCTQSLTQSSSYELLCSGKRARWWSAKCRWLVKNTILYYGMFYLLLLAFSAVTGDVSLNASSEIWMGGLTYEKDMERMIMTFVLPVLASMCIGMMELLLELVFSPAIALFLCSGYLLAGIFSNHALFVGNLTMLYRNEFYIGEKGIGTGAGMIAIMGGMILFYLLGREKMKRWEG